ncbi:MAG: glycosyltransferase family 39 protein, partial [Vicinamibacteraceae bacterium]
MSRLVRTTSLHAERPSPSPQPGERPGRPEFTPAAPSEDVPARAAWILLAAVLVASLTIRWALLGERWVNPDEGAHLMDAWLVLNGYVPGVDIATRQPLYVYGLAATLDIFGATLYAGRLLPVACSVLTGVMIYLLGSALADRRIGLLASCLYLLLPLEILQSTAVKTEAPVTLLVVSSLYAAVAGERHQRGSLLVVSGIVAAAGYYVRETALLVPVVVTIFLVAARGWRAVLRPLALFASGYAAMVLVVLALFAPFLSPEDFWQFSPISFVADILARLGSHLLALRAGTLVPTEPLPGNPGVSAEQSWQGYGEPTALYLAYLRDAVMLHGFLFVGLALAVWYVWQRQQGKDRDSLRQDRTTIVTLSAWLTILGAMYLYRYLARGFFIDYFREFLPPLVLSFAIGLCRAAPALRDGRNIVRLLALALSLGAVWFLLQARFPDQFGIGHHATLASALLALLVVAFSGRLRRATCLRYVALLAALAVWVMVSRLISSSLFGG